MRSKKPSTVDSLLEHTGFVRNLARGALGREDGSEDIVQDAWVAALQNGPREAGAERGWFYRVVTNRVTVGAGAVVGAGATVLSDVQPGVFVVGTPARVVARASPPDPHRYPGR